MAAEGLGKSSLAGIGSYSAQKSHLTFCATRLENVFARQRNEERESERIEEGRLLLWLVSITFFDCATALSGSAPDNCSIKSNTCNERLDIRGFRYGSHL